MSELKLYAFNEPLALSPNTRIRLRRVNPMFSDGRVQGSFSFPFQLPKKPNMRLLGFSHDPQVSNPITTITDGVRLEYAGESLNGRLRIADAGSFYECQFLADNGAAAAELQNKKLGDLKFANAFQSLVTASGQQNRARNLARAVNEGGWPKWPYVVFPFYNPNFFNNNPRAGGHYVANNFLQLSLEPSGLHRPKLTADSSPPIMLVITNQVGEFVEGELVANVSSIGIVSLNATDEPNRLVVLEPIGPPWGATTITGLTSGATAEVNTQIVGIPWPTSQWQCPAVYVFTVFEGIAKELGYELDSELVNDQEFISMVMLTGKSLNYEVESVYGIDNDPVYLTFLPEGFYLKDFIPQMTAGEFMEELREFWGIASYFDQQKEKFVVTSLKSVLQKLPDEDWTEFSSPVYTKELREDYKQGTSFTQAVDPNDKLAVFKSILGLRQVDGSTPPVGGYRTGDITKTTDGNWNVFEQNVANTFVQKFFSLDLGELPSTDSGAIIKSSKFGMAAMKAGVAINSEITTRMPFFGPIGSMRGFELSEQTEQLTKLLFYRGVVGASSDAAYLVPYASSDEFGSNSLDTYNYSVKFSGNKGRFKVWLSEYVDFMRNTFLVKREVNLPPSKLLSFDITRKKAIEGTHYFIKHIDITLPYRQPAEAEMYKY